MKINAEMIREYREEHGISIDEMSNILGVDGDLLYSYESGVSWFEEDALVLYILDSLSPGFDYLDIDIDDIYQEYAD